jgi:hypothetical protein
VGFLACALLTFALYLSLYFGAEHMANANSAGIAGTLSEPEPKIRLWLIEGYKRTAHHIAIGLLSIFVI